MSDDGGERACWLDAVCDRCGALIEAAPSHRCRVPADVAAPDDRLRDRSSDDAG